MNEVPDWNLIRSFLAVMESGSLMAAARLLGIHQPTVGRHIAELESQLGSALFERTGRALSPTALAMDLATHAAQMRDAADTLSRIATGTRHQTSGVVRLSASEAVASWLLPPLIADLQRKEPGIQIEIVASNQISNLLRREADIAIRMIRPLQSALVARKLGDVHIGAYAHKTYLQQAGTPQAALDLLQHRLIGMDSDDTLLRGFEHLNVPVSRSDFVVRTDNHLVYAQLIRAGVGIGFAAHYAAATWPDVHRILAELRIPPLPCWLTVHREIRGNPLIRYVYDFLARRIPEVISAENSAGLGF